MKLVPLNVKKKVNRFMQWFSFGTALTIGTASFLGGIGSMLTYEHLGSAAGAKEKIVLQQKVDTLLKDYKTYQSLDLLVQQTAAGANVGLELPKAQAADKSLKDAFDKEAQATGIALAFAQHITPADRYKLYQQVGDITPLPDYFKKVHKDDEEAFLSFSSAQSKVMNRPGFTPTVAAARDVVSHTPYNGAWLLMAGFFGPLALSIGGMFGFNAARNRLEKSIRGDEDAIRKAEEAALAEAAAKAAEEARRQAEAAAEVERISRLPAAVATALDRDISVRQIKLDGQEAGRKGLALEGAVMKLLPLKAKKKISRLMRRAEFLSAVLIGFGSFIGGLGTVIFYPQHGGPNEAKEKTVLQQKVTHLVDDYRIWRSYDAMVQAEKKGVDYSLKMPEADDKDKSLKAAFDAEAQTTGIALAHARQTSMIDQYKLYQQVDEIQPLPDYFVKTEKDDNTEFWTFRRMQARVMDKPGFKPALESTREIVAGTKGGTAETMAWGFGPVALSLVLIFGVYGAGKRLDKSIEKDEQAFRQAEEDAKQAEAARLKAEAERLAAEEAEQERLANLPVAVAAPLDRDISVRQIKLAGKDASP